MLSLSPPLPTDTAVAVTVAVAAVLARCASLFKTPLPIGGSHSADECFSCTVNIDDFCVQETSCAYPPTHDAYAYPYVTNKYEIETCWDCMAKHRWVCGAEGWE
jgi:hypothetical protein